MSRHDVSVPKSVPTMVRVLAVVPVFGLIDVTVPTPHVRNDIPSVPEGPDTVLQLSANVQLLDWLLIVLPAIMK